MAQQSLGFPCACQRRLDRLLRQHRGFGVQPDCSIRQFLSVIYIGALIGTLLLFV